MKKISLLSFLFSFCFFVSLFVVSVQGRVHKHKDKRSRHPPTSHISAPPLPSPSFPPESSPIPIIKPSNIFNVLSYGAVGDGLTDETAAIKSAWDSACQFDSGPSATLLIPQGHTFMMQSAIFNGPCQNKVIFQVDGILMAPDGPESWLQSNSKIQWLVFYRMNGFTIQGSGVIDGRGQKWWDLPCKPHKGENGTTLPGPCDSPIAIRIFMCTDVALKGLKILNSPQFNVKFDNCHGVHIDSLKITAPGRSPNTDGIHISTTDNVEIFNSVVATGDDCVSISTGCHNVDIRNITCGPSHGISIGSLGNHNSRACVSNISVTDSVIKYSDNGVRIKTYQGGFGSVSGITFNNIHMDTVRNPLIIDQYYCEAHGCSNQTAAVFVSDISYTNIKGTYDYRFPPMHFGCSDSVPCTNLTLSDIELLPSEGEFVRDPFCWNAYGASQTLTIPPVFCLQEGVPRSILENDLLGQC
ncbi:hypothetical protein MKX03_035860 [Papaver bracteatum]|nr:hypothetical protein MKX03_035860 [Papaver bracteatum]